MLALVLALFVGCNNSSTEESKPKMAMSDLALEKLSGEISTIEETPYKTDSTGNIGEMDSCCISVTGYDENGNAIKSTSLDSKGTVKEEGIFERYSNGMWKAAKNTKDGKPSGSFETTQNDKGEYTSAVAYDSTGKLDVYYTSITQNENGQVLTWKQYDKDSVFRQEGESKYENGLQTGFTLKDSVGKIKSTSTSKYNDKGELTETSNSNITKDSTTTTITKYTYESHDEKGNWTQRTTCNDKDKATKIAKRVYMYRKQEEKK
jgi:hypothetical protein